MTALEFVAVVLAAVLYGWLWADPSAKLLAPLKWAANRALTRRVPSSAPRPKSEGVFDKASAGITGLSYSFVRAFGGPNGRVARLGPVWNWLRHRLDCPVCMGFDASLAATWYFTREPSWGLLVWPAAAAGAHLVWQHVLGVARDMADALTTLADSKVE